MALKEAINVEVFYNNQFMGWFPAWSFSSALREIHRYECGTFIKDLKMSYLIFQPIKGGRWRSKFGSGRYALVARINSSGKEKPDNFSVA